MRRKRRVIIIIRKTIYGCGIKRPYVNKRNVRQWKKQKGGAFISAFTLAAVDLISKIF